MELRKVVLERTTILNEGELVTKVTSYVIKYKGKDNIVRGHLRGIISNN